MCPEFRRTLECHRRLREELTTGSGSAPGPRPSAMRPRAVWGSFIGVVDEYLKEEGAK
jgi:hypothetical protein